MVQVCVGGDFTPCQRQTLQCSKSFVEYDTRNKSLTQQFSGILKLGGQILHRSSLEESAGSEMCPEKQRSSSRADFRIAVEIPMY